ncbi:MAG TPA: alpha/beta hydrolase [Acidimicrobiia bacterium]|jgi:pimeloyl-ACP methyl ester carboxylesterase|nr:alpha/beta hydrolase [Acidimicrobiia bacterium]
MSSPSIILVPGFWLGAWAWDEVTSVLTADGHSVTALTLPGLESVDADRSSVTFDDHIDAICAAVESAGPPVVLAVHSGAGAPGYAVTDRIPEHISRMVYVDTGPAISPFDPDFEGTELPMPSLEQLAQEQNLDGLTEEHLKRFRDRAIPQPAGAVRGSAELRNDARLDVPTTVICTGFSSDEYRQAVEAGYNFVAGLAELHDVTYIDLPTSHWPMWSRPNDLATILAGLAEGAQSE